jgi:hypothetical protein
MTTTLRSKIQTTLQAAQGDLHQAAIAVCRLLDHEVGLAGDGWFRDDPELLNLLSEATASNSVPRWNDNHWDLVAQRATRALSSQLQAANRRVSLQALRRQLDESTDADLAALLGITLPAGELRAVRAVVRLRLRDDVGQSATTSIGG